MIAVSKVFKSRIVDMSKNVWIPAEDGGGRQVRRDDETRSSFNTNLEDSDDYAGDDEAKLYAGGCVVLQGIINGVSGKYLKDDGSEVNLVTQDYVDRCGLTVNPKSYMVITDVNLNSHKTGGVCEAVVINLGGLKSEQHLYVVQGKRSWDVLLGTPAIMGF